MRKHSISLVGRRMALVAGLLVLSTDAFGQPATQPAVTEPAPEFTLQPIIVTAEKREEPLQNVPVSVTAISSQTIRDAQILNVKDAEHLVPNLIIQQFNAPRESFPFIRGIGSGQNSPAVTTYIDGVPQLSFSTSNIQLVDIDRMEFLRGPQGTLYGRNTLGGVINIYTMQPTDTLHGDATATYGTYSLQDYRVGVRGPLEPGKAYYAFAGGYQSRDGYTLNTFTDHDLDTVNELFGRMELRFTPTADRLRLTLNGERDSDGDFPLYDLGSLQKTPRRLDHNYEGETHRDVGQFAFNALYHGQDVDFSSVTAVQYFQSEELTDLDETQFDLATRNNQEEQRNFIEEARLMSPNDAPIVINKDVNLRWIAGALFFATRDQPRIGNHETALASPLTGAFTAEQDANLDNVGIGVYGQSTLSFFDKLDLTLGGRVDYEYEHAALDNFFTPPIAPAFTGSDTKDFTEFSPRVALDYRWTPQLMTYGTIAKGYRAGGFNSTFVTPSQIPFNPERSWSYELGAKSSFLDNRLTLNADVFHIDWRDLQLDTPTGAPSEFYVSNAGDARSTGVEVEGDYVIFNGLDLYAGLGFDHARFEQAIQPSGASAEGKRLPYAPETTWNVGTQYTLPLPHDLRVYARADVFGVGPYSYDATNAAGQSAYILTNFRVGVGGPWWRVEGWVNNAFNTHYIPLAFPFPGAASGYVGESGDPLTAGVTLGVNF